MYKYLTLSVFGLNLLVAGGYTGNELNNYSGFMTVAARISSEAILSSESSDEDLDSDEETVLV